MKKFAILFLFVFLFASKIIFSQDDTSSVVKSTLDTVHVSAKIFQSGMNEKIILPSPSEKIHAATIGDLLKTSSSIFIRDYGAGSPQTISYRGLGAENSIILFNDAAVSDLRTGIFDFSTFSSNDADVITFSTDDFHSAILSPGGVMNIHSALAENDRANISVKIGSHSAKSLFLSCGKKINNFFVKGIFSRNYSSNNFNYIFEGKEFARANSDYSNSFAALSAGFKDDTKFIRFYSHFHKYNNGIPGFVVTNNPASSVARSYSTTHLGVINYNQILSSRMNWENVFAYSNNSFKIADPSGVVIYLNDAKESKINSLQFQSKLINEFNNFKISLGYQMNLWRLEGITSFVSSIGANESMRQNSNRFFSSMNYDLGINSNLIPNISIASLVSHELISAEESKIQSAQLTSFKLGPSAKISFFIPLKLNFSINYGNRFPTMNERFYSEVFNHYEIKKESYNWFEAGVETDFDDVENYFSIIYFNINGKDKIFWIPSRLAIQTPRNFASINSEGIEINGRKSFPQINSAINFSYTFVNALNKSNLDNDNSYNKKLIYTPQHIISAGWKFEIHDVSVRFNSQFVSQRFYTTDNNPIYKLPAYFLSDLHFSYRQKIFAVATVFGLSVYNLSNEEYSVIQSYPMPLRTINLSLNMELQ